MSWTYDPSQLSSNKIFQVRLNIGQVNQYDLITLQDEEIKHFLGNSYENITDASIKCLDSMISRAGLMVDRETGQTAESASQLLEALKKSRDDMLTSASRNTPIFAQFTGFFEEDRQEQQNDPDIYHDGLTMNSEFPETRLINVPTGPGHAPLNGSSGT